MGSADTFDSGNRLRCGVTATFIFLACSGLPEGPSAPSLVNNENRSFAVFGDAVISLYGNPVHQCLHRCVCFGYVSPIAGARVVHRTTF